jgi:hypothetical protein
METGVNLTNKGLFTTQLVTIMTTRKMYNYDWFNIFLISTIWPR